MPNEPHWLKADVVVSLNMRIVEASGEPHLLVSADLLESGCQRARNLYHYEQVTDMAELATSVLFGIARNLPFLQGNKRTAYCSMIGILGISSFRFNLADDEAIAEDIIAILKGTVAEKTFAPKLRRVIGFVESRGWGS